MFRAVIVVVLALCGCAKGFGPAKSEDEYMAQARAQKDASEQARQEHLAKLEAQAAAQREPVATVPPSAAPPPASPPPTSAPPRAAPVPTDAERDAELRALAKKHGFKDILLGESLTGSLNEIVAEAYDIRKIKALAIELGGDDGEFVAEQVLPGGAARFASDYCNAQFVLKGYRGPVYEGTSLYKLNIEAVRIVDVKSYPTALGGTAQAFVIEPAWQ